MLSPFQIDSLSKALQEIYQEIESDLLRNIASRFSILGGAPISGMAAWQTDKLVQLGALNQENIRLIAKYAGRTEREITTILTEAGYKCIEYDESLYQKAFDKGIFKTAAVPIKASAGIQQILSAAIANAKRDFNLINSTALQSASNEFLGIVNKAYLETSLGVRTYTDAIRTAVRDLADKGITGITYTDKRGRTINYHVDAAVRRNIITSTSQTAGKIQLQRAEDWGCNLVEVTSHLGARPSHAVWQGKIYSIDGSTPEYPNLAAATGYGTVEGLKGANCAHDFYPFIPGISEQTYKPYDEEENARIYEESQQQRALERDIRQQKRRILMAEEIGDEEGKLTAQIKLREKQDKLNSFIEETGRTRRQNREQVIGFGRSEAAKATWAAKKGPAAVKMPIHADAAESISAELIVPVNPITDQDKFKAIAHSLRTEGWKGNPILVMQEGDTYAALTGSHRIYAARDVGVNVKATTIDISRLTLTDIEELQSAMDDDARLAIMERLYKSNRIPKAQFEIMRAEVRANDITRDYRQGASAYERQKIKDAKKAADEALKAAKAAQEKAKKEAEELAARMAGSAKAEYDAFLARLKAKYKNIWAEMTEAEMDKLELLERALYKGK
jgi:hypothetical protein